MSNNPLNLALRFVLELAGLAAFAVYGWNCFPVPWHWLPAIALPVVAAAIWAVFRSPRDPNPVVIAVPGYVRLLLEAIFFVLAVAALQHAGYTYAAMIFAAVLLLHYALSYDRIRLLLKK